MTPVRREVGQGPQNKGPAGHPGVRQSRPALPAQGGLPAKIQQIQVDEAGGVGHATDPAERVLDGSFGFDFSAIYGFLETGIGVGNLIGGFVIGLIGSRFAKGRMIIVGYVLEGVCVFLLAFATELPAALGLMFGVGVANMIFVIPSQTLFQQRTPNDLRSSRMDTAGSESRSPACDVEAKRSSRGIVNVSRDASSERVYSCCGSLKIASVGPSSTTRPPTTSSSGVVATSGSASRTHPSSSCPCKQSRQLHGA